MVVSTQAQNVALVQNTLLGRKSGLRKKEVPENHESKTRKCVMNIQKS